MVDENLLAVQEVSEHSSTFGESTVMSKTITNSIYTLK